MPEPTHNQPEYSVSEISGAIKRTVEGNFSRVRVRGELSGVKRAASGHLYLDLKDDKSVLAGVCWKGVAGKLPFTPEDGLEVIASGKITTYGGSSKYQIVIDRMEPAGAGALMALLEQRKKALAAEGLFAAERKQKLPFMPQHIGVVTSPTGAVIRDILHRLSDRFPVRVSVWPVRVQGEGAAQEIAAAVAGFNALPTPPSLLIVARGGGSVEDLWCFNEEIVVRAVAASTIPVISAVGHETDTTLIDYVADSRAPTPTAAAEMAVPVLREWSAGLEQWQHRIDGAIRQKLTRQHDTVQHLARAIPAPQQVLAHMTQRLDDWSERLARALPARCETDMQRLKQLQQRLRPQLLMQHISLYHNTLDAFYEQLIHASNIRLERAQAQLQLPASLLESLNYQHVLQRGFAIVKNKHAATLSSAESVRDKETLTLIFQDGEVKAKALREQDDQKSFFDF